MASGKTDGLGHRGGGVARESRGVAREGPGAELGGCCRKWERASPKWAGPGCEAASGRFRAPSWSPATDRRAGRPLRPGMAGAALTAPPQAPPSEQFRHLAAELRSLENGIWGERGARRDETRSSRGA